MIAPKAAKKGAVLIIGEAIETPTFLMDMYLKRYPMPGLKNPETINKINASFEIENGVDQRNAMGVNNKVQKIALSINMVIKNADNGFDFFNPFVIIILLIAKLIADRSANDSASINGIL